MGTTNGRFLLGLLVGLLLGGGLAHFISGSKTAAAEPATALVPEDAGPGGLDPAPSVPSAPLTGERSIARDLPAPIPAPRVSDAELQDLMGSLDDSSASIQTGSGTITGLIFDDRGEPLAGVALRLTAGSTFPGTSREEGRGAPELDSLEEVVRRSAENFKKSRAQMQNTVTDDAGAYSFVGLAEGKWNVAAYFEDYKLEALGTSTGVRPGSELDFTGTPVRQIPVSLFDSQGGALTEGLLQVKEHGSRNRGKTYKWSNEDPTLRLVPGHYEVTAFADGTGRVEDYRLASEVQDVAVERDAANSALRFDLGARLGVRGRVRIARGDPPVERYYVRLMPLAPEQEVDLNLLTKAETRESVRAGGEYKFLELEAGRYVVGVSRGWNGSIIHHLEVEVTDRVIYADLNIPAVNRGEFIRVTVQDGSGDQVDGVTFNVIEVQEGRFGYGRSESMRDRDGSYLVEVSGELSEKYWGGADSGARFELSLDHAKFGKRTVELVAGQTDVAITLVEPGTLLVTVAGYQGSGYEGRLSVRAVKSGSDPINTYFSFRGSDKVGPDGTKTIEGLEPGLYEIRLSAAPKDGASRFPGAGTLDSVELEIFVGENTAQVSIPAMYTLRVHWAEGEEGSDLYLSNVGEASMFGGMNAAKLDASGVATWEDVKAGSYLVRAGADYMEVTVPSSDLDFEAMEVRALRVVISNPEGDMAKLGLQTDDLIIGQDGQEFTKKPNQGLLLGYANSKDKETTLMVERGGGQLEVRVTSGDVGGWRSLGGALHPATR